MKIRFLSKEFEVEESLNPTIGEVSTKENVITLWNFDKMAEETLGFIAHDYLAGKHFGELSIEDVIELEVEDMRALFKVINILNLYTIDNLNIYSDFFDSDGNTWTNSETFYKVYGRTDGVDRIILQTCTIDENGNEGRRFITAELAI